MMLKKVALLSMIGLFMFLSGCSFLTSSDATSQTLTTMSSTNDTTSTTAKVTQQAAYDTLFNNSIRKQFVIHFSQANFDKLVEDMQNYYDEFGSYRDNTIQEVDIDYTDSLGNITTYNEVGFRTKGNVFSRRLPVTLDWFGNITGYQQVSFQLEFNETFLYPENSTQYKELKDRRVFDLEQLNFKYIHAEDSSVVTEMMAYQLYREAGVLTSQASFAIVYFEIGGTLIPYGLFLVQEPIDDVFVKRNFGKNQDGTIGDLYKCVWQLEPAKLTNDYQSYNLGISDYNDGYRKSYQKPIKIPQISHNSPLSSHD